MSLFKFFTFYCPATTITAIRLRDSMVWIYCWFYPRGVFLTNCPLFKVLKCALSLVHEAVSFDSRPFLLYRKSCFCRSLFSCKKEQLPNIGHQFEFFVLTSARAIRWNGFADAWSIRSHGLNVDFWLQGFLRNHVYGEKMNFPFFIFLRWLLTMYLCLFRNFFISENSFQAHRTDHKVRGGLSNLIFIKVKLRVCS